MPTATVPIRIVRASAPARVRERKMRSCTSGAGWRDSISAKAATSTAESASGRIVRTSPQSAPGASSTARGQPERDVDEEDPPPAGAVDERAADQPRGGGADTAQCAPDPQRLVPLGALSKAGGDDRQGGRGHDGCAGAPDHAGRQQCRRRPGQPAQQRRGRETDDSIVNLQGRSQLPRHDPALGSFGRSVMHTPRHWETGRPRAAQFAPWAVYIPGGGTTWCGRKARRMVTADLLSRARAGDGEAFRELTESHRRELQVHCYRMLGSFADAEDAVQETMLAAWQGIGGFNQERASLRTWLYKIATNRCLNARRSASRRPAR